MIKVVRFIRVSMGIHTKTAISKTAYDSGIIDPNDSDAFFEAKHIASNGAVRVGDSTYNKIIDGVEYVVHVYYFANVAK